MRARRKFLLKFRLVLGPSTSVNPSQLPTSWLKTPDLISTIHSQYVIIDKRLLKWYFVFSSTQPGGEANDW